MKRLRMKKSFTVVGSNSPHELGFKFYGRLKCKIAWYFACIPLFSVWVRQSRCNQLNNMREPVSNAFEKYYYHVQRRPSDQWLCNSRFISSYIVGAYYKLYINWFYSNTYLKNERKTIRGEALPWKHRRLSFWGLCRYCKMLRLRPR